MCSHCPGALDKAIGDFSAALRIRSNFLSLYLSRGWVREAAGDRQGAIEDFQVVVGSPESSNYGVLVEQGNAWLGLGDPQQALNTYDQALQVNGGQLNRVSRRSHYIAVVIRTQLHVGRGGAYTYLGDLEGAQAEFDRAVELRGIANHHYNRGVICWLLGDQQQALQDFSEVIQQDPESAPAYYYLSVLRHQLGDPTGAEQDYRQGLALEPFAIAFYGADGYYGRGLARSLRDDRQQAIRDLKWAAQLYSFRQARALQNQVLGEIECLSDQ